LVVKNGSKIRPITCGGMPVPVSPISTTARESSRKVRTVSVPAPLNAPLNALIGVVDQIRPHLVELGRVGRQPPATPCSSSQSLTSSSRSLVSIGRNSHGRRSS
jgi:hypothetical protein